MSRRAELHRVQEGAQAELQRLLLRDLGFTFIVRPERWVERHPSAVHEDTVRAAERLIETEAELGRLYNGA